MVMRMSPHMEKDVASSRLLGDLRTKLASQAKRFDELQRRDDESSSMLAQLKDEINRIRLVGARDAEDAAPPFNFAPLVRSKASAANADSIAGADAGANAGAGGGQLAGAGAQEVETTCYVWNDVHWVGPPDGCHPFAATLCGCPQCVRCGQKNTAAAAAAAKKNKGTGGAAKAKAVKRQRKEPPLTPPREDEEDEEEAEKREDAASRRPPPAPRSPSAASPSESPKIPMPPVEPPPMLEVVAGVGAGRGNASSTEVRLSLVELSYTVDYSFITFDISVLFSGVQARARSSTNLEVFFPLCPLSLSPTKGLSADPCSVPTRNPRRNK